MSTTTVRAAATVKPVDGTVVPMFVCPGCRPELLDYAIITFGDGLEKIVACPMREVCTWYAAHDLGDTCDFRDVPEGAILPALFRHEPYFACANFHDFAAFESAGGVMALVQR